MAFQNFRTPFVFGGEGPTSKVGAAANSLWEDRGSNLLLIQEEDRDGGLDLLFKY